MPETAAESALWMTVHAPLDPASIPGMTISDDPRLPGLSASDTRWLVQQAQRVLAELGHESTVLDGVALTRADGAVMGLDNLARTLSHEPRKRWKRAVRDQLSVLVRCDPTQPVNASDLRAKLFRREEAEELLTYEPMEPLPGVVAMIATQLDGMTQTYGELGLVGDRDEAYDTALTNLMALPLPRHSRRRADPRVPSSWVEFFDSTDSFGAARVLVLPELLRRMLGGDFPAQGVLVAVPTKFELWVHVPVDDTVLETALAMSWLALQTWAEEPYPISPDVFLVSPDMHAVRLISPDVEGVDLNQEAMVGLLDAVSFLDEGREAS